jgi:PST family polysaccharide transporter
MAPAAQVLAPKVMYLVAHDEAKANWFARRIFAVVSWARSRAILTEALPTGSCRSYLVRIPPCRADSQPMVFVLPISVCTRVLGLYFILPRKLERLLLGIMA